MWVTFIFINFAWVFFRAYTISDAFKIVKGMIGLNGIALPAQLEGTLGWLSVYGFSFGNMLTAVGASSPGNVMLWIVVFLLIAVIGRNTDELVSTFKPSYISLILVTALFLVSLYNLTNYSEFIYFRF